VHFGKGISEGKTREDFLSSFVRWAKKLESPDINVSKAMRRLIAFTEFQDKHWQGYLDTPVAIGDEDLARAAAMMEIQVRFPMFFFIACKQGGQSLIPIA